MSALTDAKHHGASDPLDGALVLSCDEALRLCGLLGLSLRHGELISRVRPTFRRSGHRDALDIVDGGLQKAAAILAEVLGPWHRRQAGKYDA